MFDLEVTRARFSQPDRPVSRQPVRRAPACFYLEPSAQIGGFWGPHFAYRVRVVPSQISMVSGSTIFRKYFVFLLKTIHLLPLLGDSVIQKPPSAALIDLMVVSF